MKKFLVLEKTFGGKFRLILQEENGSGFRVFGPKYSEDDTKEILRKQELSESDKKGIKMFLDAD
jgi:hypothetical protein